MRKVVIGSKSSIRPVLLGLATLVGTLGNSLLAQTITGMWQGTVPTPEKQRIVLKIANADNGQLHGMLYRIDMSAEGIALSAASFQAPNVSVEETFLNISYAGKLSADGKSISGTWTQDKQTYPVIFVLATPETVWKHEGGRVPLAPMAATADPAFEVATIKPSPPDARGPTYDVRTRQFTARGASAKELIKFAYRVRGRQVPNGPSWMDQIKFDIDAVPDTAGQPSEDQYRVMVKKLLAERFQLEAHSVQQIFPVYALTLEGSHPKVVGSDPASNRGSIYVKNQPDGQILIQYVGHTMPMVADTLMGFIQDRQVVDETGLTGRFDFAFTIPASEMQPAQASGPEDERGNAFMRAIEPLGFKLVPKKEPIEVIVVDRLEKPSAN
jgi:uncharacterized protein (TIGR03435 family)